ncbi:hypothetical protein L6386_06880 [bacterium]|nr:hypothetical protein [bacterium]
MEKEEKQKVILKTLNGVILFGLGIIIFVTAVVIPEIIEMERDIGIRGPSEIPQMKPIFNFKGTLIPILGLVIVIVLILYLKFFKRLRMKMKIVISEMLLILIGVVLGILITIWYLPIF